MKAEYIIRQLYEKIPPLTNYFSETVNISSLSRSGSTVTAVTSTNHGLVNGQYVSITGAKTPTLITSLTQTNGIATAVCDQDHDLTEGWFPTVEITGATQSGYNGTFELLSVPNRLTFTYRLTSNPVSPATSAGDILLLTAGIGNYNGRYPITVINSNTFTYNITTSPYSPAFGTTLLRKNIRISGAATIERAIEGYTKQATNKLWAFVVIDDTQVSKDRYIRNDAIATRTTADEYRMRLIKNFSVYVFAPSTADISARTERDLMEDLEVILYKSLLAIKVPSPYTEPTWSLITPVGNGFYGYNNAYYIHRFQFQTSFDILIEDTAYDPITRAFRDISLNYFDFTEPMDGEVIASIDFSLDDEPL
jgi:hypothetical protein